MRGTLKRLRLVEERLRAGECTCGRPVTIMRGGKSEEEWEASLRPDEREALDRSCPLHPNRPQVIIVRWALPRTALDE